MEFSAIDFDLVQLDAYCVSVSFGQRDSTWHAHEHFHQITLAETGTLRFEDASNQWLLPPQRAVVVPANVSHRVHASGPGSLHLVYFGRKAYAPPSPDICVIDVPPLAREMIRYARRWGHDHEGDDPLAHEFFGLMNRMLPEWLANPLPLSLPRARSPELAKAVVYLQDNLDQAHFKEAARIAGLSQRSLGRRFREETGIGWRTYAQLARVLRAIELLSLRGARITDIALEVGFSSLASFSTAFRKLMGMSPRTFRSQQAAQLSTQGKEMAVHAK